MTTQFSFTRAEDGTETIVLIGSQGVRVVPDTHVNYTRIKEGLLSQDAEQDAFALADAATIVGDTLTRLSERVTLKGDKIFFDGDVMETRLTRHIVDMLRSDDDNFEGYVAFLENVQANPSKKSRKSLFNFLDKHELVITEDGQFIGYKALNSDGKSVTAGHEDVTVTLPDGTVETHKGHIPNPVGATVEMPRSLVDPDRDTACSVGLHVGNFRYATGFVPGNGQFVTVKVNPRDVVAVPSDSNDEKIRTHRYTVVELNPNRTQYTGTSLVSGIVSPMVTLDAALAEADDADLNDGYDDYYDDDGNLL
jgi:hypothetical protein